MCRKLILLNGPRSAPTGQKYRHQPRSTRKMSTRNKTKITNATGKKKFGTNFPGFRSRTGIVPVRNPTGQISVKINPMRYEVTKTRLMSSIYFM
jgi:hypothetical protein